MIRSARYIGRRQRTVRYDLADWANPEVRRKAFEDARAEATALKGDIIIKVYDGRRLQTRYKVSYHG